MPIQFGLESLNASGGRRALIISPPETVSDDTPELVFNIDTYQNVSMPPDKEKIKKDSEIEKYHEQLKRAKEVGDSVAVERLNNQIRFSEGKSISEQILKYDNLLLSKISPEKSELLYKYFSDAQWTIHQLTRKNRRDIMTELSTLTLNMMRTVDLADICIKFVDWIKPPIPDSGIIGRMQHHSAAKTFEADDYKMMTALAILSKLMFPLWGQYSHRMKAIGTGSMDKEFYCLLFLEPALMQSKLSAIYDKFKNYTFDEVNRSITKTSRNPYGNESNYDRNMFTVSKQLNGESQFQTLNLAKIIVKRLVGFDIESSSLKGENNIPNVMIFCQAIMDKNVTNTLKQFNNNSALLTRDEPRGGGDDNFTFMENCSRISQFPPDGPITVRYGCELTIPRLVEEHGFDLNEFWEIVNFYSGERLLKRNVFTDSVLSIYMFPIIGSSKNLNHLRARQYIMAVAYVQLILLKEVEEDYGETLAVLLSAGQSAQPRENKIDSVTTSIDATSEKCVEYRELMERYPHSCETIVLNESIVGSKLHGAKKDRSKGTINIARHVEMIKNWLLDYDHTVNLCPRLWNYIPALSPVVVRQKQNDILQYSSSTMENYYQFLLATCPEVQEPSTEGDKFFAGLGYS